MRRPIRSHRSFASPGRLVLSAVAACCALLTLVALLLVGAAQAQTTIEFPGENARLQLNGSSQLSSTLRITPATPFQRGSAFSRTEISTVDTFKTAFQIDMHESNTGPADGMAFVVQSQSVEAQGEAGGELGYTCISPSAEVEFDIYPYNTGDPPKQHIAFMENGNAAEHLAYDDRLPFELYGEPVDAWVEYDASTEQLRVFATQTNVLPTVATEPAEPLFEYHVNLAELLHSEAAYAGFTASTGLYDAVQEVRSWQLIDEGEPFVEPLEGAGGRLASTPVTPCGSGGPPPPVTPPGGQSPSSGTSPTTPAAHATTTQVQCKLVVANAWDSCTASVKDGTAPQSDPTGMVSFASSKGGSFSAGKTCALTSTATAGTASCSVRFLPPTKAGSSTAIAASYPGDGKHAASIGKGAYVPASALGSSVAVSRAATLNASASVVEVPVSCRFACVLSGEASAGPTSGIDFSTEPSALALRATEELASRIASTAVKRNTAKQIALGRGRLVLAKPAKGMLRIKLNANARRALRAAGAGSFKAVLSLAVGTTGGTAVKVARQTLAVRPHVKATAKR